MVSYRIQLATALFLCWGAHASAQSFVFDFEDNVTVEANADLPETPFAFANRIRQDIGDLQIEINLGQLNQTPDVDDPVFNFLGATAPNNVFNISISVNNLATGDTGVLFNLESFTVGDVPFLESITANGAGGMLPEEQFTAMIDFAAVDENGDIVVTTDDAGNPIADTPVTFFAVSFTNDDTTERGLDGEGMVIDFGVDFPSIDDITLTVEGVSPPAASPGDFNGDDLVNAADFTIFRDNVGAADDSVINNAGDGVPGVTEDDYLVFVQNFDGGQTPQLTASATTVPEPGALALVLGSLAGVAAGRRRR